MKREKILSRKQFCKKAFLIAESEGFKQFQASGRDKRENAEGYEREKDFFAKKPKIAGYSIFDVLDNEEIGRLMKSISKLGPKFKVLNFYRFPSFREKKLVYIPFRFQEQRTDTLADIEFLEDEYFSELSISTVSLDNWKTLIQYEFRFKESVNYDYYNFVKKRLPLGSKRDFWNYRSFFDGLEQINYALVENAFENAVGLVCQSFITTNLYSKNGQRSLLPSLKSLVCEEEFDFNDYQLGYLENVFINKEHNYAVVIEQYGNREALLLSSNGKLPELSVTNLILHQGAPLYFAFFGYHCLTLDKIAMSSFTSEIKKPSNKDLSRALENWFSFKFQFDDENDLTEDFKQQWIFKGDKSFPFYSNLDVSDYRDFYKNSYEYLKTIYSMNYDRATRRLSYVAILISVLSILASIILRFIPF